MQDSALEKDLHYQKLGLPTNNLVRANLFSILQGSKGQLGHLGETGPVGEQGEVGLIGKKGTRGTIGPVVIHANTDIVILFSQGQIDCRISMPSVLGCSR